MNNPLSVEPKQAKKCIAGFNSFLVKFWCLGSTVIAMKVFIHFTILLTVLGYALSALGECQSINELYGCRLVNI